MNILNICRIYIFSCATCPNGYHQSLGCSKPCWYPFYGYGCSNKCNCRIEFCNHIHGCQSRGKQIMMRQMRICDGHFVLKNVEKLKEELERNIHMHQ